MSTELERGRRDRIHDLIELLQREGLVLDFTAASLQRLDAFLTDGWGRYADRAAVLLPLLADYVGETVRRNAGGSWDGLTILLDDGRELQPSEAIKGRLADGELLRDLLPAVRESKRAKEPPQPITRGYRKRPGPSEEAAASAVPASPPGPAPSPPSTFQEPPTAAGGGGFDAFAGLGQASERSREILTEERIHIADRGWKFPLVGYGLSLLGRGYLKVMVDFGIPDWSTTAKWVAVTPLIVLGALALLCYLRGIVSQIRAAFWLCTSERHARMGLRLVIGLMVMAPFWILVVYLGSTLLRTAVASARAAAQAASGG